MSYSPTEFSYNLTGPSTTFFLHYNGSAQSVTNRSNAVLQVDTLAHGGSWSTDANYQIEHLSTSTTLVARADGIMTPPAGNTNPTITFGSLVSDGNPTFSTPNAGIYAYQDHPARTSYHTSLSDEVLHMQGTSTMNVRYVGTVFGTSTNFTLAVGRIVIGGFVR